MNLRSLAVWSTAILLLCAVTSKSHAQITPYSQDFEGMGLMDAMALETDGWLVFGNVWDDMGVYQYGYGPFVAPNSTADNMAEGFRFSLLAENEGGAPQGTQQLVTLNDYNNGSHVNDMNWEIEANVFREWVIDAADVGSTWEFQFDAALRDLAAPTTANAFIKTLDPNAGYATTNLISEDMSSIGGWATYSLTIDITNDLVGQILQIGFANTVITQGNGDPADPSGILYDNIIFDIGSATPNVMPYSQDFESLGLMDAMALENDGWLVFGNVWDDMGVYQFGYGPFAAPNSTADNMTEGFRFSLLTENEGDAGQGTQQLVVFNDYNNGSHVNDPNWEIESLVFREWVINSADVGSTWEFKFDAANRDLASPTIASAFIKTLDPNNGFAASNLIEEDMSSITGWSSYSMTITIDSSLIGHILQIGFSNTVITQGNGDPADPSGILYDNISFDAPGPSIVTPASFSVGPGDYVSGGIAELSENDTMDLTCQRRNADVQSRITLQVEATSPAAMPTSLEFTLKGSVFARSTVTQTLELFDYDTMAWEQVDMRNASRFGDSTVTVTPVGDLSRFVEPGTNRIEAQVRFNSLSNRQRFRSNTDQMTWTIE
ncbi:MAG: hypothetical protein AAF456_19185 [Planctomycetota bacterium]